MFCGFCGANNPPEHRFCVGCGKELGAAQETSAVASPAPQPILESVAARLRTLANTEKLARSSTSNRRGAWSPVGSSPPRASRSAGAPFQRRGTAGRDSRPA